MKSPPGAAAIRPNKGLNAVGATWTIWPSGLAPASKLRT